MTLDLKNPFLLIDAGPSSCGKSTFVIRLLGCRGNFVALRLKILCGVKVKITPRIV